METLSQLPATGQGLKEEQVIRSLQQHGLDPGRAGPRDEASASSPLGGTWSELQGACLCLQQQEEQNPAGWKESLFSYTPLLVPGAGTQKFLECSGSPLTA